MSGSEREHLHGAARRAFVVVGARVGTALAPHLVVGETSTTSLHYESGATEGPLSRTGVEDAAVGAHLEKFFQDLDVLLREHALLMDIVFGYGRNSGGDTPKKPQVQFLVVFAVVAVLTFEF